jgi:hypothetical protein
MKKIFIGLLFLLGIGCLGVGFYYMSLKDEEESDFETMYDLQFDQLSYQLPVAFQEEVNEDRKSPTTRVYFPKRTHKSDPNCYFTFYHGAYTTGTIEHVFKTLLSSSYYNPYQIDKVTINGTEWSHAEATSTSNNYTSQVYITDTPFRYIMHYTNYPTHPCDEIAEKVINSMKFDA